ncbi:MAG: hypothetical protein JOZ54_08850 [Acidobacteria bacterium]|nr:hypothetical protein [Acidobacteriota bacterium]
MVLGLPLETFTRVHVVISLIGIVTGLVATYGLIGGRRMRGWTTAFLVTTILTSVTGFFFPFHGLTPAHVVGVISLIVLALAGIAMQTDWRKTYAISSVIALYLNCFVLVVQSFQKVPALHALAPKGNEPPFAVVQLIVLALFVWMGFLAARRKVGTAGAMGAPAA